MAKKPTPPAAKNAAVPAAKKGVPRYVKNKVTLNKQQVDVYATPKLGHAIAALTEDMTLYQGVKFEQIMEALYEQGKKDGAREAFGELDDKLKLAKKAVPHANPGAPKKK